MQPGLLFPRNLAILLGGLLAVLGGLILLFVFGTPANDPAGAPTWTDVALAAVLIGVPLVLVVLALRTRKLAVAWLCAGSIAALLAVAYVMLFV